ncbi:MAG: pyruvate kinase [Bdellovibrionales bacterium]|jgi:pyruvate kinase|nr:pyruvate kinase [Bdellovibrionales bacterium]MBT3526830.1 pyruvate kinase [Bdellovibrionales bacterium]MBT7767097.1 pyruvate kinase [Bdellovibrionales bacterium]
MSRRTKIVATLGPATDQPEVLDRLIKAGVDVVRINLSHGTSEDHLGKAALLRQRAAACERQVGIIADLQGPKIRITSFKDGEIYLEAGASFAIDPKLAADQGDDQVVGCLYQNLPQDLLPADQVLLDDGQIVLEVEKIDQSRIHCRVVTGGKLSGNKGLNRLGGGLSAKSLTDKDLEDIKLAVEMGVDYLAVSFVRHAQDVYYARKMLNRAGGVKCGIIAKIERQEAIEVLDEIIDAADAIMVARGDLGVEIGDAALPPVQKRAIKRARQMNKAVITATQMMESMIVNSIPTRAEVFDVANAVLDGTDAIMLSAETATGKHPIEVVEAMDRICIEAEKQRVATTSNHRINTRFTQADEAIAMATMYTANHLGVKAIAALTESGSTTLWMSRISSGLPIYALSRHASTQRRVTLLRGVYPVDFDLSNGTTDHHQANREIVDELMARGVVKKGELVIVTKGDLLGERGTTNSLKIIKVGEGQF